MSHNDFNLEKDIFKHDPLILGEKKFFSRLIIGTGKYADFNIMKKCHETSGTEMVTVALRRVPLGLNGKNNKLKSIIDYIDTQKITLLPNTSGTFSAKEAYRLAKMAVAMGMRYLKIEVMGDTKTLLPDPIETLKTVEILRKEFTSEKLFLMVYTNDDPIMALKLLNAGADCIMPAGSPIGSGRGIQNPQNLKMIIDIIKGKVPIVLDAGIGSPADAALAMEAGASAILLNTAVAKAQNPEAMAKAMRFGWIAGRLSYIGGRIPQKLYATASSPEIDF
ncbi:MAG: thiazole synthase [Spirochaetia bacterium]|nr:thiazole synthase [Spirochaetia bacterium]